MQLTITSKTTPEGGTQYHWQLFDGPDGIDDPSGTANSLGEVFETVIETRIYIAQSYR